MATTMIVLHRGVFIAPALPLLDRFRAGLKRRPQDAAAPDPTLGFRDPSRPHAFVHAPEKQGGMRG